METWGNGKGTAFLLAVGIILILAGFAIDGAFYFGALILAILGALFMGVGLAIFLTWLLFTDRKADELFAR